MTKFLVTWSIEVDVDDNFQSNDPGGPAKPTNIIDTALQYSAGSLERTLEQQGGVRSVKLKPPERKEVGGAPAK